MGTVFSSSNGEAAAAKAMALMSEERSCAEALMMACDERLGAQSPAALMVCDTFLARDFWTSFVHQSYLPPAASQVWAWNHNFQGQLGLGDWEDRATPTEVTSLHGRCIHAVVCGAFHTMAVVDDGELLATGYNGRGQLGLGDTQNRCSFTRVSGLSGRKVAAVACGDRHAIALLESGELFAWGCNEFSQLGLGLESEKATTPEPVAALSGRRVAAIACGADHSVAVLETGELFAWGFNFYGQLGVGDNAIRNEPTQVTALTGRRVVAVACGDYHTAAVLKSGELFTWGCNEHGQLGHGDRTESKNTPQLVEALRGRPVIAVACGYSHTLALLKTGEVFVWGWSTRRPFIPFLSSKLTKLFDGSVGIRAVLSSKAGMTSIILESGEAFVLGLSDNPDLVPITSLAPPLQSMHIVSVALGNTHAIALVK